MIVDGMITSYWKVPTRSGASNGEAHGTTIAKASGEDLLLVNAKIRLERIKNLVSESDVVSIGVRPTGVQALGCDEDSKSPAPGSGGRSNLHRRRFA